MRDAGIGKKQKAERKSCLEKILSSKASKKLIAAGPGTGKTFTFGQLLAQRAKEKNLALTFIKKLVDEMKVALAGVAEVKTFHAFCKKILHQQNGKIEVAPFLPEIIQRDADLLENGRSDFVPAMQMLAKKSQTIGFYLARGDYYEAVGFDDAVYRLFRQMEKDPDVIEDFGQLVVDEFQDFNPLEVALIELLGSKSDALIVGDDDQAVYDGRCASPQHLREWHKSGKYEVFELPFCSRCTSVVVEATNAVVKEAVAKGHFAGRIPKRYECYLEAKEADSTRYPKLITACCTLANVIPKYIKREIEAIPAEDIAESRDKKTGYPTVLIIGPKQYLQEVDKQLRPDFPQIDYTPKGEVDFGLVDAYEWLLRDPDSNLGWRIVLDVYCKDSEIAPVVKASEDGTPMVKLIDKDLVKSHRRVMELIKKLTKEEKLAKAEVAELKKTLGDEAAHIIEHFTPKPEPELKELEPTKPTIKMTSFVGCKGLSAGHVFVLGVHADSMPRDPANIQDREISQFIVALTRTRKCCHLISNKWLVSPRDKKGNWNPEFAPSPFMSWMGDKLIEDRGQKKAADFK